MKKYIVDQVVSRRFSRSFNQYSEILNLNYPTAVSINVPFNVSYEALNKLDVEQRLFGYITDEDFNLIAGTQWEKVIQAHEQYFSNVQLPGITETFDGIVVVGHIGDDEQLSINWSIVLIPAAIISAALIIYK